MSTVICIFFSEGEPQKKKAKTKNEDEEFSFSSLSRNQITEVSRQNVLEQNLIKGRYVNFCTRRVHLVLCN